jgi:hypothetical protein
MGDVAKDVSQATRDACRLERLESEIGSGS